MIDSRGLIPAPDTETQGGINQPLAAVLLRPRHGGTVTNFQTESVRIPVCRTSRFIIDNYRAVAKVIDKQPNTVMHGDAHPGNVYFRNGEAALLDWQAVRRGHPGRELSYTLITR